LRILASVDPAGSVGWPVVTELAEAILADAVDGLSQERRAKREAFAYMKVAAGFTA
jgi:hypothetical protein